MTGFTLSSDAAKVAAAMAAAAVELVELEPVNKEAGALVIAAPAPRRSGRLAADVRADVTNSGVTVGASLPYWTFVHWGAPRRNQIAQPWLANQVRDRTPELVAMYAEHANTVLANIGS